MKKITIRDTRKKEQFIIDDIFIDLWARHCGIYATGVYMALCRHADLKTQECWPSIRTIAEKLGISERAVNRSLKRLEEMGIILREKQHKRSGGFRNIYILTDKSAWRPPDGTTTDSRTATDSRTTTNSRSHSDCQSLEGFTKKDSHFSLLRERDEVQKLFPGEKISEKIELKRISYFLWQYRAGKIAISGIRSINAYLRGLSVPEGWDPKKEAEDRKKQEAEAEARLEAARKIALRKSGYKEEG